MGFRPRLHDSALPGQKLVLSKPLGTGIIATAVKADLAGEDEAAAYIESMSALNRGASEAEVQAAYRKLARKYHPDVSREDNAEERFKEVQEAYAVLKDSEKRQAYDQLGGNWRAGQEFRPPTGMESTVSL